MTATTGSDPNVARLPIRPDLLDAEPYHWEEGLPEGRLRRFDMNLSPVPPAWYGRAVATLGRVPVNTYPDATHTLVGLASLTDLLPWMAARFADAAAPSTCS